MSYGVSAALQAAIFQRLAADSTLAGLVGTAIYDAAPSGVSLGTYVSLGPELVRDQSDKSGSGAEHIFTVSVVTDVSGFQVAKDVAAAVSDTLLDAALILARGRLVSLNFVKAVAKRVGTGDERRIDLSFRARVEDE